MDPIIKHNRRPDITFYRNGRITITARIARMLSLQQGDCINVMQDGQEYLLHVQPRPGCGNYVAACYRVKPGSNSFYCSSTFLCQHILEVAKCPDAVRAGFFIGYPMELEGTVFLPIITLNPQL